MIRILSIRNRQRAQPIDAPLLRRITKTLLREDLDIPSYELGIHLLDAEEMAMINETFLQHQGSTDVITFDHAESAGHEAKNPGPGPRDLHGEIFLSVPDAMRQAREFKTTWQGEVIRYVIHGLLHLMGHDDIEPAARRSMKRVENQFVKRMAAVFPLSKLARQPKGKRSGSKRKG
ncbi:MAG TPA: rRNA maturation RNase YbeY [Verrucomicrobiae bacterium]|nr:rRNA maturation RNase YbeY [Verrucomicrobiae bacterium]